MSVVLLKPLCNARKLLSKLGRETQKALIEIQMARPSSNMSDFRSDLAKARHVVVMTGAGVSAESGIPTFRGAGGMWRKYQAASLATPEAFESNPSLVWEFYHYRREMAAKAAPNACHIAIAEYQMKHRHDKSVTVVTQNVDGLHVRAGSTGVIELHGNLFKTRCTKCKEVLDNTDSPICEALSGRGAPDTNLTASDIPVEQLPHCKKPDCGALLRPHIVWFEESLNSVILEQTQDVMDGCDLCLVVGTSAMVYPAAMFAPAASEKGAVVAEFNIERTTNTHQFNYYFEGPCGTTVPQALA